MVRTVENTDKRFLCLYVHKLKTSYEKYVMHCYEFLNVLITLKKKGFLIYEKY